MNQANPKILRAFTVLELIVSIAVLTLLTAILLPSLASAKNSAKAVTCARHLATLGQALHGYATTDSDSLPTNVRDWSFAACRTNWTVMANENAGWIGKIRSYLLPGEVSLIALRCPSAEVIQSWIPNSGFSPTSATEPGACWYLNSYCSGRKLSSIPNAGDGVMVLEVGVWDRRSADTGALEDSAQSWVYPHPRVEFERSGRAGPWAWLNKMKSPMRRNILWVDGHVSAHAARTWPNGDQPDDPSRIRHMRFGLPGTNPIDP